MEYEKLGDYCDITSSKRVFANQYVSDGIPFYRSREIIEKKESKDISEPLFISKELYDTFKRKFGVPQKGDLLLTSVGTLGIPYIVKDEVFYFKDGNLAWMKNFKNGLDSRYLYYWLNSKFGKESLIVRAIGSSQASLTIDILKKYKLFIPSIKTQNKIVDILSAYDDLIENNNRRIALLEKAAQELYKEWFVRFRFPGHETVKFENGLPVGWNVKKLADYGKIETGKTPSTEVAENYGEDIMFVKTPDMHGNMFTIQTGEYLSQQGHKCQPKKLLPPNSIMVSCIGTGGVVSINVEPAHTNQQINSIIIDNPVFLEWLFFTCKSLKETIELFGATGATMTNLSKGKFEKLKVIEPTEKLILLFHDKAQPFFEEIKSLMYQNQNLTKQRDLLLPRLMSGKLEV